ncbi:uncharacterized protein LOC106431872 [Brassica napus]|uniref:uncharacterized protein LOC106431872 n=1 Tax=Brassica napus TaxID=3708 RepID=UPI002078D8C5|nr:uncharacterized protein LOC106431872 [Brassica napus]
MRHHLIEGLKDQYMTIESPLDLWNALKHRYDHQKMVLLPKARHDWMHLRFMDFKSVDEYNSALFKIVSILRLCGEEVSDVMMLEKTYTTFNQSNSVLQQHGARPVGTAPLPEAHDVERKYPKETNYAQDNRKPYGQGRGGYRGRRRDNHNGRDNSSAGRRGNHHNRGRGSNYGRGRGSYGRGRGGISKPSYTSKSLCHRCGMDNHWAKNCRTPKHLCELYQESIKNKNPEANMIQENDQDDKGYDADNESDRDSKDDQMDFETSDCLKD